MDTELPFQINKRIAGIVGIIVILFVIPVTVLFLQQQQQLNQHAAVIPNNTTTNGTHDTCNRITVQVSEDPSCPRLTDFINNACTKISGGTNPVNSYSVSIFVISNDGKPHKIAYTLHNEFCKNGYFTLSSSGSFCQCSDNDQVQKTTAAVPTTIITHRFPTTGSNCGSYQVDFRVTAVDGNSSCTYIADKSGATANCETGINCSGTPPTQTPVPTITPTQSPSQTPTPTPTPTSIPPSTTPTPTACIVPSKPANVKIICPNCST